MFDEVITDNDILSENEQVRSSRIKRIMDEMHAPENLEFISRENVDCCIICDQNDHKHVQMNSFVPIFTISGILMVNVMLISFYFF